MTPRPFAIHASLAAAVLFCVMSVAGLQVPTLYARETDSWTVQAIAQDWFDLTVAVPCLVVGAIAAARGSLSGVLVLGGSLLYAVYTLLIYAFAIHLNAIFLVYCATLGLALFALIAVARSTAPERVQAAFGPRAPRRVVGGFLVVVGIAFGAVWLSELVPAVLSGQAPPSLVAAGMATNPVHVIDLSFVLPLHVVAGVALWRGRALGFLLAPVLLAFGALMTATIAFLAVLMERRGVADGGYPVAVAMAGVAALSLVLLVWMLWTLKRATD